MAVLEAGISLPGEMARLEKMIKPDIGIFTNLGDAHDVGFKTENKTSGKTFAFKNAGCLVYNGDDVVSVRMVSKESFKGVHCNWGYEAHNALRILNTVNDDGDMLSFTWRGKSYHLQLPNHKPSVFWKCHALHLYCIVAGRAFVYYWRQCLNWQGLDMRLQLTAGKNECLVVNDSYTNDLQALAAAWFFWQNTKHKGTVWWSYQKWSIPIITQRKKYFHSLPHPNR